MQERLWTPAASGKRAGLLLASIVFATYLTGCSSMRGLPVRYVSSEAVVESIKLSPDELAALQSASSREERNQYQNKAVSVIDLRFHQFVRDLVADRADMSTTTAGTTLAASTAGAFVDSVAAKTNYALFGAGIVGAFGILDKNYYYDKTVPALVAAMGAARAEVLVRIRQGQADTVENYNGVMALEDVEEYFSAGTILSAVAGISARADSDKQASLAEVRSLPVPTDEEINRRKRLSNAIFAIDTATLDQAKKALTAIGLTEQKSVKDTRLALLRAMRPPTRERLDQVEKALKDSGLLK
jgi:hypothetical protein